MILTFCNDRVHHLQPKSYPLLIDTLVMVWSHSFFFSNTGNISRNKVNLRWPQSLSILYLVVSFFARCNWFLNYNYESQPIDPSFFQISWTWMGKEMGDLRWTSFVNLQQREHERLCFSFLLLFMYSFCFVQNHHLNKVNLVATVVTCQSTYNTLHLTDSVITLKLYQYTVSIFMVCQVQPYWVTGKIFMNNLPQEAMSILLQCDWLVVWHHSLDVWEFLWGKEIITYNFTSEED